VQCQGTGTARYRVFVGIGSYHNYFRANISAACFRTSFSIRSCRFSLRRFSSSCSAGVRLSFSWLDPVALIRFTHLSKADAVRSYSRMISLRGLPWLNSSTSCFFYSSLNVRFARLGVMVFSSLLSHYSTMTLFFLYRLM
jgi:hypothetical protein